jgi:hypothetical protein
MPSGNTDSVSKISVASVVLYQKLLFRYILEGLGMEYVRKCYVHLKYFMSIWYILLPLGKFCNNLVYFLIFGLFNQVKSGNTGVEIRTGSNWRY